jgi:hypothetical protein
MKEHEVTVPLLLVVELVELDEDVELVELDEDVELVELDEEPDEDEAVDEDATLATPPPPAPPVPRPVVPPVSTTTSPPQAESAIAATVTHETYFVFIDLLRAPVDGSRPTVTTASSRPSRGRGLCQPARCGKRFLVRGMAAGAVLDQRWFSADEWKTNVGDPEPPLRT